MPDPSTASPISHCCGPQFFIFAWNKSSAGVVESILAGAFQGKIDKTADCESRYAIQWTDEKLRTSDNNELLRIFIHYFLWDMMGSEKNYYCHVYYRDSFIETRLCSTNAPTATNLIFWCCISYGTSGEILEVAPPISWLPLFVAEPNTAKKQQGPS